MSHKKRQALGQVATKPLTDKELALKRIPPRRVRSLRSYPGPMGRK